MKSVGGQRRPSPTKEGWAQGPLFVASKNRNSERSCDLRPRGETENSDGNAGNSVLTLHVGSFRPFQLHFEALHADLETVHRIDRRLGRSRVVVAHEA